VVTEVNETEDGVMDTKLEATAADTAANTATSATAGAVQGQVMSWLRAEGLCVLLIALWMYGRMDYSWMVLAVFFMAPDLSMLAYRQGARFGSVVYNAAHSYIGPLLLAALAIKTDMALLQPALIWLAHIGFCRLGRFGLKYPDSFGHTHLGQPPFDLPAYLRRLLASRQD
jgi:hypothetical protein